MLDAFKIKPFELEPIYADWKDAPHFTGNPKKDPLIDDWLEQIKAGCVERKVPREYWHKVAQHYMTGKAKTRFEELKLVMKNMHGGKYCWTWKNFKVAMRNMGWDIDSQKTESIKVESKPSGLWWIVGRNNDSKEKSAESTETVPPRPVPKSRKTLDLGATMKSLPSIPMPRRTATMSSIESVSSASSSTSASSSSVSSSVSSSIGSFFTSTKNTPVSSAESSAVGTPASTPGGSVTTVSHVPIWLVNACQSLEVLTNDHPKVMTALSAILITVGSLPALPAISAGAGGAFLASSTAVALGQLAVGLGTILQAQTEGKVVVAQGDAPKA